MKKYILLLIILSSFFVTAQLSENSKFAYERTAFKRWDEFKPEWIFLFAKKYKKDDKRTMYARAKQMSEWSIYQDGFEIFESQIDSTYKSEQYKAIDRTVNKTWLLVQKPKVNKLKKKIDAGFIISTEVVEDLSIVLKLNEKYDIFLEKIEISLDAYVSDAKKEKKINEIISDLESLLNIIIFINTVEKFDFDNEEASEHELLKDFEKTYKKIFPEDLNND